MHKVTVYIKMEFMDGTVYTEQTFTEYGETKRGAVESALAEAVRHNNIALPVIDYGRREYPKVDTEG